MVDGSEAGWAVWQVVAIADARSRWQPTGGQLMRRSLKSLAMPQAAERADH